MATQHSNLLPSIFLFIVTFCYLHSATTAATDHHATAASPASSPTSHHTTSASPASSPTSHHTTSASPASSPTSYHIPSASPTSSPTRYHSPSTSPASSPTSLHATSTSPASSPTSHHTTSASAASSPTSHHATSASPASSPTSHHATSTSPASSPTSHHTTSASPSSSPTSHHATSASPSSSPTSHHATSASPASSPTSHHATCTSSASSPASHHSTCTSSASSPTSHHSPTPSDSNAVKFIREYCDDSPYSDVCFSSLYKYADTIKEDPILLIRISISVSLKKARSLASYINGTNSSPASGLQDCSSRLNDALEQIHQSVKEFRRLSSTAGQDKAREQINNIQSWLSTAASNVHPCTEGLKGLKDASVQTRIENQATEVIEVITSALTLVVRFANQANI